MNACGIVGAADELAPLRVARVVINKVQVAQRMMRDVEANIGTDLMRILVVLKEDL